MHDPRRRQPIAGIPRRPPRPGWGARIRAWLSRPALWIGTIVLAAVAAALGSFFQDRLFPQLQCEFQELGRTPADGGRFTVLVSRLSGDDDGSQTRRVVNALENERGFERVATCRSLDNSLDTVPGSVADAESQRRGRDLLARLRADLLIWGEVSAPDKSLRLRFLTAGQSGGGTSYGLRPDTLDLPSAFDEQVATQITAAALTGISPLTKESGRYLVERLRPLIAKLRQIAHNPPKGSTAAQVASLHHSLGTALSVMGEQAGDNQALEAAVTAYGEALKERTRERVPLDWAMTQNNLGTALQTLGGRENGTARLEAAVAAYGEALKERTRERVPLDWAMTTANLGHALMRMAERRQDQETANLAVDNLEAALKIFEDGGHAPAVAQCREILSAARGVAARLGAR